MINFIKEWANQIIVAVIITTIFEMILPDGNNKKYIKMIIGLYVLFTIIGPIITKITGESLEISNFNYKKYFNEDIIKTTSEEFDNNNSKLIEQAYIDNIKEDIKNKIRQKGYEVINCRIDILGDGNKENYGTIQKVNLRIKKAETEKEVTTNIMKIEDIDVNVNNNINSNSNNTENSNISDEEKTEIIEYLSQEYSIDRKQIIIN